MGADDGYIYVIDIATDHDVSSRLDERAGLLRKVAASVQFDIAARSLRNRDADLDEQRARSGRRGGRDRGIRRMISDVQFLDARVERQVQVVQQHRLRMEVDIEAG